MIPSLSGLALHSGALSTLSVSRRADDGAGLRFFWPGFDAPLHASDLAALRRTARRATVLENSAGARMRTPEHLLAAALFFAGAPLDIVCDAVEPPGLDGSARPFFELFSAAASPAPPRAQAYASNLDWEHDGPEGSLRARPHTHFSVRYLWEQSDIQYLFDFNSAIGAPEQVLPARTFIEYRDWIKIPGGADLLAGAGDGSGMLLATTAEDYAEARKNLPDSRGKAFPLLHPEAFRFPDEPARHKVLDLLGDLALNGLALPKLRLEIRNGGHALNHLLLDRLQSEIRRNP